MTGRLIQIIYLNGPSSSGKTTLAKALQQAFAQPFLHVGIDKIIDWMPEKVNNWTGGTSSIGYSWKEDKDHLGLSIQELQVGAFAKKIGKTFQEVILTLAREGYYLIIDDVSFGKDQVDSWRELLKEFSVLWVGIKSPLPVLEQREKERQNRMVGSARGQFYKVHKDISYDLEIDTHHISIDKAVSQIQSLLSFSHSPSVYISRTGVYGVAKKNGKILLVTKDKGPYLGRLDLPGGKIEFGEGIEEALHREFIEEVGMDFESMFPLGNFSNCFDGQADNQRYRFHHIGMVYSVTGLSKTQPNSLPLMHYVWVDIKSLSQERVCPFVWEVIKQEVQ
jgi:chloramphenicol 3-O phosphotransferase